MSSSILATTDVAAECAAMGVRSRGVATAVPGKASRRKSQGCSKAKGTKTKRGGKAKRKGKAVRTRKASVKPDLRDMEFAADALAAQPIVAWSGCEPRRSGAKGALHALQGDPCDLLAAAQAELADLDGLIGVFESSELALAEEAAKIKLDMDKASVRVEESVRRESLALEQLMAARLARIEAERATAEARGSRDDAAKSAMMLGFEAQSRKKVAEIEQAKMQARQAAEAAKQALEDSKRKEKEALEAMRSMSAKGRDTVKTITDGPCRTGAAGEGQAKMKMTKAAEKEASKLEAAEFREIEKMRAARAKLHERAVREASGLLRRGCGRNSIAPRVKMLTRPAVLADVVQPRKAARVEGAD